MVDLDYILERRMHVYKRYLSNLTSLDPLTFISPSDPDGFFPWGVGLRILDQYKMNREQIQDALKKIGVETRIGFSSASSLPYYKRSVRNDVAEFPVADSLEREVILLPHYPSLSDVVIDEICSLLLSNLI